jgi:hypothetical protein
VQVLQDAFGDPEHFPDHVRLPRWICALLTQMQETRVPFGSISLACRGFAPERRNHQPVVNPEGELHGTEAFLARISEAVARHLSGGDAAGHLRG